MTDKFDGDNAALCQAIDTLLALGANDALVPNGIGRYARTLLSTAAARLRALEQPKPDFWIRGGGALAREPRAEDGEGWIAVWKP